jgi:hypothetical protein
MNPWITNFLLLVISCRKSSVGACKTGQVAFPTDTYLLTVIWTVILKHNASVLDIAVFTHNRIVADFRSLNLALENGVLTLLNVLCSGEDDREA